MKILIPIPSEGFDPSEVAVSWRVLHDAGHDLYFATPDGRRGHADPLMLSGEGLDPWAVFSGLGRLKLIGLLLRARADARKAYHEMEQDVRFAQPLRYYQLEAAAFDALLLPGGHAKTMRPYLENAQLQALVVNFFEHGKPVAAICHGVLLAARSVSPKTGKSVLHGRRTTALTWDLERTAWHLTKYIARFWDPDYYRTYTESHGEPTGYRSVQAEVMRALANPGDFCDVPDDAPDRRMKTSGLHRDTLTDSRAAFVVRDGDYVSARWPGDVYTFARTFDEVLRQRHAQAS